MLSMLSIYQGSYAQNKSNQIKRILSQYSSYKYSDIYVYKIKTTSIEDLNSKLGAFQNVNTYWKDLIPNELLQVPSRSKASDLRKWENSMDDHIGNTFFPKEKDKKQVGQVTKEFKGILTGPSKFSYSQMIAEVVKEDILKMTDSNNDGEEEEETEGEGNSENANANTPPNIEEEANAENANNVNNKWIEFKNENSKAYSYTKKFVENLSKLIGDAYIITNRPSETVPSKIIGVVLVKFSYFMKEDSKNYDDILKIIEEYDNLGNISLVDAVDNDMVVLSRRNWISDENINGVSNSSNNFDDYLQTLISQSGAINITANAQGILDEGLNLVPKKFGVSKPVSEDSIQQYLRITEGQPFDYQNEHELTIGLFDVIRYRFFKEEKSLPSDEVDESVDPVTPKKEQKAVNHYLPVFGIELKYGLNEINYPSLWSERMTLNVMWQSNKLGIILPTNGWSQLSKDFFNIERRLTNAGLGLYGSFDLPIKLINQGGVFNFNGSYVFGDAKANPINSIMMIPGRSFEGRDSAYSTSLSLSYLPRFHAQAHYSFAINIDKYTFFRFKLGATAFLMQRYADLDKNIGTDPQTGRDIIEKANRKIDQYTYADLNDLNRFDNNQIIAMSSIQASEMFAGLSGRIEFMTNTEEQTVPWGGAMQYFDGALSGDIWLQVPIGFESKKSNLPKSADSQEPDDIEKKDKKESKMAFSLRAQAQFFQTVLRDPRPWELQTVVMPSLQLLLNF